jgi:hypothetical protein
MIERAAGAAVPFAWVAGDEVNGPLRTWLETRRIAYVLAVACDHRIPAGAGRTLRANQLAARLPGKAWQRLSAGAGAKGHRWYDWAWVTISDPGPGYRYLLIRRNRSTGDLAFYRCYSPQQVTLAALVKVAVYRNMVCRHPSLVSPDAFQAVRFQAKHARARAWTYLPVVDSRPRIGHNGLIADTGR